MPGPRSARVRAPVAAIMALLTLGIAACGEGRSPSTTARAGLDAPSTTAPPPVPTAAPPAASPSTGAPSVADPPSVPEASEVEAPPAAQALLDQAAGAGRRSWSAPPTTGRPPRRSLATNAPTSGGSRCSARGPPASGARASLPREPRRPAGAKEEGDGRTPSGAFGFDFFFGVQPDPGVRFPYRQVTGPSIVWDDDPSSPRYNEWVDLSAGEAGVDPEPMYQQPAYDYGAVIAYNAARTPGLGSAIFLHVSTGGPTAGCVSLPEDRLLAVLRWLDPARQPVIVVGVAGA